MKGAGYRKYRNGGGGTHVAWVVSTFPWKRPNHVPLYAYQFAGEFSAASIMYLAVFSSSTAIQRQEEERRGELGNLEEYERFERTSAVMLS